MKDCEYIDYEGVCGITCKVCDGSINETCKYYHNKCYDQGRLEDEPTEEEIKEFNERYFPPLNNVVR